MNYRLLTLVAALLAPAVPAAAQVKSRTIDLPKIFAQGTFAPIPARTIELKGIIAAGSYQAVLLKPRTIDLPRIFAEGLFSPLKPRTIDLKGIAALGVFVKINKSFQLAGWTASPPTLRGKR